MATYDTTQYSYVAKISPFTIVQFLSGFFLFRRFDYHAVISVFRRGRMNFE